MPTKIKRSQLLCQPTKTNQKKKSKGRTFGPDLTPLSRTFVKQYSKVKAMTIEALNKSKDSNFHMKS